MSQFKKEAEFSFFTLLNGRGGEDRTPVDGVGVLFNIFNQKTPAWIWYHGGVPFVDVLRTIIDLWMSL